MTMIPIENKTGQVLRIMLEPWAIEYDINHGETVEVSCDVSELKIDVWPENFVAIWVPSDEPVLRNGEVMTPISV